MTKFQDGTDNVTSFDANLYNDLVRALKNAIEDSGQTIDATNIQLSEALANYAAASTFYTDSGSADVYDLSSIDTFKGLTKLIDGATARFRAANLNTGASTVNVAGTGVRDIKLPDGTTDPAAGDISITADTKIRYDLANNAWVLDNNRASESTSGIMPLASQLEADAGIVANKAITPATLGGSSGGRLIFISESTPSAVAQVDFVDLDVYDSYLFIIKNLIPVTNSVSLNLRVSDDNGSTFKSGASDYRWVVNALTDAAENSMHASSADNEIIISGNGGGHQMSNNGSTGWTGTLLLTNLKVSNREFFCDATASYQNAGSNRYSRSDGGGNYQANAVIDAIRLLFSSGNISSGNIKVYGIK